jgi:hypothetical protein
MIARKVETEITDNPVRTERAVGTKGTEVTGRKREQR